MLGKEQWWEVISNYNVTIFPMQIIIMAIGVFVIGYFFAKQNRVANVLLKTYFSLCSLWVGIVFFMILGKDLGAPMNIIQGSAFVAVGVLMAVDIFTKKTIFTVPKNKKLRYLMYLMLSLIAVYAMIGLLAGRGCDKLIYFGTLPCPTTALTLIFMMMALPKVNKVTYILLLVWAIPFAPLIQIPKYHVYEDSIMFLIGLVAIVRLIYVSVKNRKNRGELINEQ